jgi:hypothetical protein
MRYWTIVEPGDDGVTPVYLTYSDDEILAQYWDHWYGKMCEKYGKVIVDNNWTKQDCIDDWVVVHWALESNNES